MYFYSYINEFFSLISKHTMTKHYLIGIFLLLSFSVCGQNSLGIRTRSKSGEAAIRISDVKIDVKVIGPLAVTTVDMVFYNPNDRTLEGELQFPLAEGQSISRFALDINGTLREGVVVDKNKGQEIFESITRRKVDPGLLEKTKGNNFRTRIYPLPAKGSRRIVIAYEQELPRKKDQYQFILPIDYGNTVENFSLGITVFSDQKKPSVGKTPWANFAFDKVNNAYIASFSDTNFKMQGQLVFSIPAPKNNAVYIENGKQSKQPIFYTKVFPKTAKTKKIVPQHISLFWDASLSMSNRDLEAEIALLDRYFLNLRNVSVDLYTFNCILNKPQNFNISEGKWTELKNALKQIPYDGGTQLGVLDFSGLKTDKILLFTDGLSNFGESVAVLGDAPVSVVNSSLIADHDVAKYFTSKTGGAYINLKQHTPEETLDLLMYENFRLISAEYSSADISDFTSGFVPDLSIGVGIAGKLNVAKTAVKLNFGIGSRITRTEIITIDSENIADYNNLLERVWAEKRIDESSLLYDRNREEIESLGREYNIVTRNTSLIVLDNVWDYINNKITPPADLLDQYNDILEKEKNTQAAKTENKINRILPLLEQRMKWWERRFPKGLPIVMETKYGSFDITIDDQFMDLYRNLQEEINGLKGDYNYYSGYKNNKNKYRYSHSSFPLPPPPPSLTFEDTAQYIIPDIDVLLFNDSTKIIEISKLNHSIDSIRILNEQLIKRYNIKIAPILISIETVEGANDLYGIDIAELKEHKVIIEDDFFFEKDIEKTFKIKLNYLKPDAAYMTELADKSNDDMYEAYLKIKGDYETTPAFYLDVASLFEERGLRVQALIILSNLAELKIDDYRIMRVLAHRLKQLGYNEYAISLFEEVLKLRSEEPQSYRDLGLTLAQNKDYQAAISNLYTIIEKEWDSRFNEIELIAIEEINDIIQKAKLGNQNLDVENIDERLLNNMPVDIRVVLNWDTDNSDMDLWVTDPYDEMCYYSNTETRIGGMISKDMTGGYGPEEFLIKDAVHGKYKIQVKYYGSQQQTLVGPTTIYLDIFTGFSSGKERKETIMLRLSKEAAVIDVGEIDFE